MSDISLRDLPEITYEKREFKPVEAGDYTLRIAAFEVRKSQNTGTPYICFTLSVVGPTSAGRKIWKNLFPYNANEVCRNNFWSFVYAATGKNLKRNFDPKLDLPNLVGRNIRGRVTIETDNKGKDRNNATFFGIATDEYANAEYNPTDQVADELPNL